MDEQTNSAHPIDCIGQRVNKGDKVVVKYSFRSSLLKDHLGTVVDVWTRRYYRNPASYQYKILLDNKWEVTRNDSQILKIDPDGISQAQAQRDYIKTLEEKIGQLSESLSAYITIIEQTTKGTEDDAGKDRPGEGQ